MAKKMQTIDGNYAASYVAYAFSEVAAIYPITPSSTMGEYADIWASQGQKNMFGQKLEVVEMQSEAGAAGAVHGSLSAGALTTTYTASQGLLLMIPNMYKIAGEMLPTVFHVSARALAAQSLSIFGDHSDVMSCRATGYAMTSAASIQETHDLALVAHLATLESEIPFLAFFDGFRTSHEFQKVELLDYSDMKSMLDMKYVERFRNRALRPDAPYAKMAAQNPDVYFQGRETTNKQYEALPAIVQKYMDKVGEVTGRKYHLFDYVGAADADKVIVAMGSACETIEEAIGYLNAKGRKLGLLKVRLYRPFAADVLVKALPATVKKVAVLDRCKEPGSLGEPLFLDVKAALAGKDVTVIGGRYGLASKEFTPSMVNAIYKHMDGKNTHNFTVGINDDVTGLSLPIDEEIVTEPAGTTACMFWGLGGDGTVGSNKNSVKIIGDHTNKYVQAYFVYDSKKSGGITVSHLRFGDKPITSEYTITAPNFVACHNPAYIGRYDMLAGIVDGGTFLINSELPADKVFESFTREMQEVIVRKHVKVYTIDALKLALEVGSPKYVSTIMQTCFFKLANIIPADEAIGYIKSGIEKKFKKKGDDVVKENQACVDQALAMLKEVEVPASLDGVAAYEPKALITEDMGTFANTLMKPILHQKGDDIPVSAMSYDGSMPTATSKFEKRGIAPSVPKWDSAACIQCNQCVMACPHAAIRSKLIEPANLAGAPASFNTVDAKPPVKKELGLKYRLQVFIEDCTGCGVCVETCPVKEKAIHLTHTPEERAAGQDENVEFFLSLPDNVMGGTDAKTVKGSQFLMPYFEFSGACAGCGETPYVKLVSQLFGNRMIVANATGCSSIYGGSFPSLPYCKDKKGRGPAWANSLFEDNAEYGFGMRLAVDTNRKQLMDCIKKIQELGVCCDDMKSALDYAVANWENTSDEAMANQEKLGELLKVAVEKSEGEKREIYAKMLELKDYFVDKSVWILGGDGWAYDIGFGGLDHVVAQNRNVNILVLDTEVYSNTGGQASKSTPIGAVALFANSGKRLTKKNLGFMCMSYGNVYVASISMGANRQQALTAIREAEAHNGPSIILAYAPCIAHGINMSKSQTEAKRAVEAGYWPLYRYNPAEEQPFKWETKEATASFQEFIRSENRYKALFKTSPADAEELFTKAEADAKRRMTFYKNLGELMK
ncbi:pyruvate:ferredoxin (flavodoxin) oxidoreductase [Victivallaceae bacterium BBE-744-WT-12]|uniref:Pyruvate:ferredoxin (Flavodoxin) oxidoreductase n=1 Tax=Victivallis lenta TaxID=2606640 RepID=A0A844G9F9_9BACT|nr:pyruvate:ferredoxin (flavodoxin) oxidoreductase [Victivallis lenta]MST98889.1 pyruvate:ferredoxin (flavodoxin) oxidoreductase [Victivallis lenta]